MQQITTNCIKPHCFQLNQQSILASFASIPPKFANARRLSNPNCLVAAQPREEKPSRVALAWRSLPTVRRSRGRGNLAATMEDAVLLLIMLFVLVMASYMLDRYACMMISQSGFALVFGLLVGILMIIGGKHAALHNHLNFDNNLFFNVLLPPIIYESGFSIKRQAFFRNFPAIVNTAVFGTVIATCVTGGLLYFAGQAGVVTRLSWVETFLFGALISAVDPVATLACFNKLDAPPLLFNLVFGESILNDAVVIALYQTLQKWEPDSAFNVEQLLWVVLQTTGMFAGSLVVGALITLCGAFMLKRQAFWTLRFFPTYEISLCLIFSLLTYFVADSLKLSGIVALFFSGTMTAHYHFHTISREAQHSFTHLLHTLAFVCESIVYVFMGISFILIFAGHVETNAGAALRVDDIDWTFIFLTLLACVVARFCNIFPLLGLSNLTRSEPNKIPVTYMSVIWFAGLRGSICFALAKNWTYIGLLGASHRRLIESTTLMVVLFTTIVIGGLTGPLLARLGLVGTHKEHNATRTESDAESDTSSTTSGSQNPLFRPSPRLQLQARHMVRGSLHFVLREGTGDLASTRSYPEAPTSRREAEERSIDPVLTPRPQFLDCSDDEEEQIAERSQPTTEPPALHRQGSAGNSMTGVIMRSWQTFDTSYMQPIFGGQSQSPLSPSQQASPSASDQQLGVLQKESVV